jgi:hypothetical protein
MQEELNEQPTTKVPTKEEVIAFMQEQIVVKTKQLELQELNTKLAVARAEEIKALSFIGNATNPQAPPNSKRHILTEEDFQQHPDLTEQGFKVGDEVMMMEEPVKQPAK